MTEQEKQIRNHFLTLYIGECWHEWIYKTAFEMLDDCGDAQCSICGKWQSDVDNYNFYTPNDFHRLRKWMEENQPKLLSDYIKKCFYGFHEEGTPIGRFNSTIDPSNLFEFLKEHREEWEWGNEDITTQRLQGTYHNGKVQHKAAKYLDSIKEE